MNLRRRLRALFRRRDLEAEMAEEMRFHLEQRAADLAETGLPPDEARLAAQRRFGNTASLQERSRDAFGWGWLDRTVKDLALAARQLARNPGFSLLAVITLGLGLGANTSMFSMVQGISLKPLPYANLDRLDRLFRVTPQTSHGNFPAADFLAMRDGLAAYGEVAAYHPVSLSLSDPGQPAESAYAAQATANFFTLLGVQPELGRLFVPGDDRAGRDRIVVLSQRVWRNRFGAAPDIVGRRIRVDGEPHEVVGVLPASFNDWRHLGSVDFFRPLAFGPADAGNRPEPKLRVIGLRRPGLAPAEASGVVAGRGAELAAAFPEANAGTSWRRVDQQSIAGGVGSEMVLPLLLGLSGCAILLACSNLANFLLARTLERARELAVRAALGASRLQLLRPLFAEALLLSLAGGTVAILVAHGFTAWAAVRSTGDNGEQVQFVVDQVVLLWTLAASVLTAFAFSLAPALFALRLNLNDTLKSGGRGATGSPGHQRFRKILIVGQFALAMSLLAGAALFIRGIQELHDRRAGWQSAGLVTGSVLLPGATYSSPERIAAFQRLTRDRLAALPGVAEVSLASASPFFHWPETRRFVVADLPRPQPGHEPAAMINRVDAAYFDVYRTPLRTGRAFTAADRAGAPRVVILSHGTARALFGDADPVGHRLAFAGEGPPDWAEIVGVAADIESVDPDPNPVVHRIYLPLAQEPPPSFVLAVKAAGGPPDSLVTAIRGTMSALDPDLPVTDLQGADAYISRVLYQLNVLRDILGAFGALGLGLAAIGIYGVIARTMAQRRAEFAIRLALGASVADITRLVLGTGVRQALLGAAIGLLGAIAVSGIMTSSFPGIRPGSPLIIVGSAFVLVAIALLACWLPARRAGRINALDALRAD